MYMNIHREKMLFIGKEPADINTYVQIYGCIYVYMYMQTTNNGPTICP